jgi:hypothetical protein
MEYERSLLRPLLLPEWLIPPRESTKRGGVEDRSLELWCLAACGDQQAKQALIAMHRRLAVKIAHEQSKGLSYAAQDEQMSQALLILCTCIDRWDPSRGPLGKFLAYRIKMDLIKWRGQQAREGAKTSSLDDQFDEAVELSEMKTATRRIMSALESMSLPPRLAKVALCMRRGILEDREIMEETGLGMADVMLAKQELAQRLRRVGAGPPGDDPGDDESGFISD